MKKSELYNLIDAFVEKEMTQDTGSGDLHVVKIPVAKNDNITIGGVYGKRGIDGVVVAVWDSLYEDYKVYNATTATVEHPAKNRRYFKESTFEDKDAAVKSMYDTIIVSLGKIEDILNTPYQDLIDGTSRFNETQMGGFAFY